MTGAHWPHYVAAFVAFWFLGSIALGLILGRIIAAGNGHGDREQRDGDPVADRAGSIQFQHDNGGAA